MKICMRDWWYVFEHNQKSLVHMHNWIWMYYTFAQKKTENVHVKTFMRMAWRMDFNTNETFTNEDQESCVGWCRSIVFWYAYPTKLSENLWGWIMQFSEQINCSLMKLLLFIIDSTGGECGCVHILGLSTCWSIVFVLSSHLSKLQRCGGFSFMLRWFKRIITKDWVYFWTHSKQAFESKVFHFYLRNNRRTYLCMGMVYIKIKLSFRNSDPLFLICEVDCFLNFPPTNS